MNHDGLILRQVLVCLSGSVYWIGVLLLAASIRRRTGRSVNLTPRGPKERALWSVWIMVIVVWIAQPLVLTDLAWLGPMRIITPLYTTVGLALGALLLVAGQLGTYWCYWAMGDSWRVGVRRTGRVRLVTRGPYSRVRHPIYSFQTMLLMGAACLLPTALSCLILVLQVICSYFKATDEEAFLARQPKINYAQYCDRTGRFLPRWAAPQAKHA